MWISIQDKKPEPNQHILAKNKHGIIECFRDEERDNVGTIYMWQDLEFYIYEWMPFEEFAKDQPEAEGGGVNERDHK